MESGQELGELPEGSDTHPPTLNPKGGRGQPGRKGQAFRQIPEGFPFLQVPGLGLKTVLLVIFLFTLELEQIFSSLPQLVVYQEFHVLTGSFPF